MDQKDITILNLYYEKKDANAINKFFIEAAGESAASNDSFIQKIKQKIKELIEQIKKALKDWWAAIKRKIDTKRVIHEIKKMTSQLKIEVRGISKEKEVRQVVKRLTDLLVNKTADMRQTYEKYMSHKITYNQFGRELEEQVLHYENETANIMESVSDVEVLFALDSIDGKGQIHQVGSIADMLIDIGKFQEDLFDKIYKDADAEQRLIEQRAAAYKAQGKEGDVVQEMNEVSSATSKISSALAKVRRLFVSCTTKVINWVRSVEKYLKHVASESKKADKKSYSESFEDEMRSILELRENREVTIPYDGVFDTDIRHWLYNT